MALKLWNDPNCGHTSKWLSSVKLAFWGKNVHF